MKLSNTMKRVIISAVSIAFVLGCASRPAVDLQAIRIAEAKIGSSFFQGQYVSTVSRAQVVAAPKWKRTSGHPPLSVRKADELATAMFRKHWNLPEMERTEIRLVDMGDGIHWFYVVEFEDMKSAITGLPTKACIIVLMDGTVIEPKPGL